MIFLFTVFFSFFFNDPATTEIYTLSLHDALPILALAQLHGEDAALFNVDRLEDVGHDVQMPVVAHQPRSEEHTSELQSQSNLVCRLLLEKKKKKLVKHR